ncbi:MAG: hypothetical protein WBC85_09030 [Planktotalea sp.]|uniref:hypothetical protein n=1 Tax=Planktotalea sp. TaxID=2029877 RepID=UPI003C754010
MSAKQIFQALQDFDGEGAASRDAANAGFLEWALSLPLSSSARREAKRALVHLDAIPEPATAAQLFIAHLRVASCALPDPVRRGGARARRRVLH